MEKITSVDIFIGVVALIFLLLWIVYLVRVLVLQGRVKSRNKLLLAQYEKALQGQAALRTLQERVDGQQETLATLKAELAGTPAQVENLPDEGGRIFRQVLDAIRASRLYAQEKATREDVMALVHLEKKELDAVLKGAGVQLDDLFDDLRLEAALPLLREAVRADKPEDGSDPVENAARTAGFSGKRALGRKVKDALGMPLEELLEIL